MAILGGSGYTAAELLKLLVRHPHAEVAAATPSYRVPGSRRGGRLSVTVTTLNSCSGGRVRSVQ